MGPGAAGRRLHRLLAALPALAALGVGCELLVDGELDAVLCSEEGAIGPPACPERALCRDGACVEMLGERALGAPCAAHSDCGALDFCLDPARFGGEGPSVCARACCNSSDCDPVRDAVCWVPDQGGGGLCRVGRDVGRPEVGTGRTGDACAAPGDCRSGMCVNSACVDTCCSDTNCASPAVCRLTTGLVSAGTAWACRQRGAGSRGYFEECEEHADCSSGLCATLEGIGDRCTIPCCASDMCPASPGDVMQIVGCAEVGLREGSTVRACTKLLDEHSFSAVGVPCTTDDACRGGICVRDPGESQGFCSDVCCGEASCGDIARFGCRPHGTDSSWALRCEPK
ncbi:hypothetical protein WME76_18695 [Sorangium sp. So ce119]|uniref:hypothetical protein n=1 Tax=Sorangium sp. So ce119 TaxID=3133279 RepID=UPI003F5DC148